MAIYLRYLQFLNHTRCSALVRSSTCHANRILFKSSSQDDNKLLKNGNMILCSRMYAKGGKRQKNVKAKINLTDEELSDVIDIHSYRRDLQELIDQMKSDYVAHLLLRSAAGSIENILVTIEDEKYPICELAQISRKNPNLVAINMAMFPEGLKPTLNAINESGLGVNPQQDGTMIYLPIPKVTRELREKLAKNAKTMFGKTKDQLRLMQNQFVRQAKEKSELSEDLLFSSQLKITAIADEYINEAEKLLKAKEKELLGET